MLRDQRVIAGIGRAWANEILHHAKLSPYELTRDVTPEQVEQLGRRDRRRARRAGSSSASAARTTSARTACTTSSASPATSAARRSRRSTSRSTRSTTAPSARPAGASSRTAACHDCCADVEPAAGALPRRPATESTSCSPPTRASTSSRRPRSAGRNGCASCWTRIPARANAFGDDGFHPLGLACFFGHVDAARLLLERGADVNALSTNEHVQTAAIHAAAAAAAGSDEAMRYELVQARARARCRSEPRQGGGFRAIDAARQNGDARVEQLLLEHGADGLAAFLPGVEQVLDVPALRFGERHVGEQPPHLRRVVVLHRRFEMLARRRRLLELAAQPAQQADLRCRGSLRELDRQRVAVQRHRAAVSAG